MELLQKVTEDIKEAMRAQEKERLSALRMLKSALIENKTATAPRAELEVVIAHAKKIRDSMESFPEGNSARDQLKREVEFLKPYLPGEMSESEVRTLISDIMTKLKSANSGVPLNLGMVMKELSPQIKGRFDGKIANTLVQQLLQADR